MVQNRRQVQSQDTPSTTPKKRYQKQRQQQYHDEFHRARHTARTLYGELVGAQCPTTVCANQTLTRAGNHTNRTQTGLDDETAAPCLRKACNACACHLPACLSACLAASKTLPVALLLYPTAPPTYTRSDGMLHTQNATGSLLYRNPAPQVIPHRRHSTGPPACVSNFRRLLKITQ